MRPSSHDPERPPSSEVTLLGRLGLNGAASDDQVEAAHDEIAAFLTTAPASLRAWAYARMREADEAYVLLRTGGHPGNRTAEQTDLLGDDLQSVDQPVPAPSREGRRATGQRDRSRAATRERRNGNHAGAAMLGDALGGGDWYEPAVTPRPDTERRRHVERVVRGRAGQLEVRAEARRGGLRRVGLAAGIVVALGAVGVIGFKLGEPSVPGLTGTPAPQASGPVVDQAQVTALMTRLAADPEDVEALQGLANIYFGVNDFATAALWLDKLLAVEPENISALLGAGAAAYNLGKLDEAETAWTKVVELEPDNVEAHYDLGFLYLAQEPPDLARVEQEWRKVIELDPDSDIAKTVAAHLEGLVPAASGSPGASPAGSPEPASSASPEPAASASPAAVPSATGGS